MARCGYCYDWVDHNRVGCPKRKADVETMRKDYEEGDKEWYPSLLEQDDRYRTKKHRKCSYCYNRLYRTEHDHNRRNCPKLVEERAEHIEKNKEWRVSALALLKEKGLAAGAVVRDKHLGLAVVTQTHWDNMSHLHVSHLQNNYYNDDDACFTVASIRDIARGTGREEERRFPSHETLNSNWRSWGTLEEVVVPATERIINKSMPKDWLDGASGIDFYFDIKYDKYC